ncbi:hypothetical protein [Paenibacillus eucommiae]|uniref:Uncharacterized protein n=1 Tax=Paenibacillus eucommiae TaxID=1355755 RepID=A0ABS4J301_9BACL|nr:hypothetical protein [Paenibacillus eucommiae]MBP1994217.1 hypothetical protein [Paenibacillus eucommiae]
MLRKRHKLLKGYVENSYHEYGIHYLTWSVGLEYEWLDEANKLAVFGANLSVVINRMEYAEYSFDQMMGSYESVISSVNHLLSEIHCGDLPCEDLTKELELLNQGNVQFIELLQEADVSQYKALFALGEQYFSRLVRIKEIFQELRQEFQDYVTSVMQLAEAFNSVAKHLEYLALRQFYAAVRAKKYQEVSSLCIASDFFFTASRLLIVHMGEASRPEVKEARVALLSREYNLESLCSLGRAFDFRKFDDELSPLMPEVVDMLFWEDEPGREEHHNG